MSEPKSAPPDLPGFTFVRGIGSGGFADVFLYQQHHPRRQVAVKVLRHEHVSAESLLQFEHEANTMAQISDHQFIVAIHDATVAGDGRPYIVMEYYPNEHFGLRARGGALSVTTVLEVAVQVASAVATAHLAGIKHRDIKPANILTSKANKPGLTDFGISASRAPDGTSSGTAGFTVPFAPPEVLSGADEAGSELADIYSLGATIYCLLEGRSPFYVHGGDNSDEALFDRVVAGALPALERQDLPASLRYLLANAMSIDPGARPPSALAFARDLQDIEQELQLPPTAIDVVEYTEPVYEPPPPPTFEPSGDHTRVGLRRVDPVAGPTTAVSSSAGSWAPPAGTADGDLTVGPRQVVHADGAPSTPGPSFVPPPARVGADPDRTTGSPAPVRTEVAAERPIPPAKAASANRTKAIVGAVAGLALVVVIALVVVGGGGSGTTSTTTSTSIQTSDPLGGIVGDPQDVQVGRADNLDVVVSWSPPEGAEELGPITYLVSQTDEAADGTPLALIPAHETSETARTIAPDGHASGSRSCFQVQATAGGRGSDLAPGAPACWTWP